MRLEPEQMWGYFEWLISEMALVQGLLVAVGIALLAFIACYLVASVKWGPAEGFYQVTRVIYELLARDLPSTSFKRIYALARLAFQEAIRRKVLVLMAVFIVVLLFAGWFLDTGSDNVAQLYISFVMTGTSYLVLLLGLFLSCFSLPTDVKNKTIQTITTKPVRSTEIVLGRILGFSGVGTLLLLGMGLLSYGFVTRGIVHQHEVESIAQDQTGNTTYDARHAHTFEMLPGEKLGVTSTLKGHSHVVRQKDDGTYEIGPPEGLLLARIPIFGKLHMTDRSGNVVRRGINVGYESEYQTYIEGNSPMSAVWTFAPVNQANFVDATLPIEMTLQAFRTLKADIVTGVRGELFLRNEQTGAETERRPFIVQEGVVDRQEFTSVLPGSKRGQPTEVNIWDDICSAGNWQVIVRCVDRGQYFGMSQADLYVRAGESRFGWNLAKGFVGIWLQMIIVICLGVMFSTFLSGPVAMVATLSSLVLGFFGSLALDVASGAAPGGGPLESLIRIPMHTAATIELDLGNNVLESAIQWFDRGILYSVAALFHALPSFAQFNTSEFVAYGYNIPGSLVCRHLTMAAAYFVLCSVVGYFFLKTRELASS
ncbi:MAG: ABC transporter permease [Pirellulaceae bacterium]|nr:ABC transporter permease [Pirellulaceae bacterium]